MPGLVGAHGYVLGRDAVVTAPVLAPHRVPLHLAGLLGTGTVLGRLDLGTPGVWLAAFVGEVVLASLVGVLTVLERRSSDALVWRRHPQGVER